MLNANEILFRCSSLGHLMKEPKELSPMQIYSHAVEALNRWKESYAGTKNKETKTAKALLDKIQKAEKKLPELSTHKDDLRLADSTIIHLVDVYVSAKYNRFTEIKAKQLDKGNDTEEDSITVVSLITGDYLTKNTEHLSNEFIKGTPDLFIGEDIRHAEVVRDTKSAWDIYSFNRNKARGLKDMYYWQGMGYMALTGAKKCFIDHCLNNTPDRLINKELYNEGFNYDHNTPAWVELQIIANHVYDKKTYDEYIQKFGVNVEEDENSQAVYAGFVEVPLSERHFSFEFDRDEEAIEALYQRVRGCRNYMNEHFFKSAELVHAES